GAGARPASVRHDLSGAIHGPAAEQCGGLSHRVADQFRRRAPGKPARRARVWRRQCALPGNREAGESPRGARQTIRHDGVPQSHARNQRGAGDDDAHLQAHCAVLSRAPASSAVSFVIEPPVEPMLAKLADELPAAGPFLYEPKWDGFRAIGFGDGSEVFIQSRDLRPLDRYFPELHELFLTALPDRSVIDGEIVIATARGLDFDALQLRLHPAASRAAKPAKETPAAFVAFDPAAPRAHDLPSAPPG